MKILIVSPEFLDERYGGIALYVYNIVRCMNLHGHQVAILTYLKNENKILNMDMLGCTRIYNVGIEPKDYLSQLRFARRAAKMAKYLIKKEKFDICHSNETSTFSFSIFCDSSIPFIITYHSMFLFGSSPTRNPLANISREIINVIQFKKAKKIIVMNSTHFEEAINRGLKNKTTFIPNLVDTKKFRVTNNVVEGFRKDQSIDNTDVVLLYVGRLVHIKGVDILPDIMLYIKNNFKKDYDHIKMIVVGDGPLYHSLCNKKELYEIENLILLGWQDHQELPKIFKSADMLILPSLRECSPTVILEALSCGLPIISTRIHGIKDLINDEFGTMVEYDHRAFGNIIMDLVNNREKLHKMGKNSLIASNRYDVSVLCRDIEKIYESIRKR